MRRILKIGTTALMLSCMGGNVLAATASSARCANPEDMFAVRVAAVQQRLMVAALSCNATPLYNEFVIGYRKDLQTSDAALQKFFRRLNAQTGTADYHAFKTRMANASSMESIRNTNYCTDAQAMFDAASNTKTLKVFLSAQTTSVDDAFSPCKVLTASTASPAKTPPRRR